MCKSQQKSVLFLGVVVVFCLFTSSPVWAIEWDPNGSWQMFDSEYQTYNYAPSSIISEDGTVESHFYCSNKDSGVVRDHIYLRQRIDGIWQPKTLVLPHGASGWDSEHACDPSVIKGSFDYDGTNYQWAMFYLGCDVTTSNHNQIGVAFANSLTGPWIKWSGNPIIPFGSYDYWGVGQPSATSIDDNGKMWLFYTRGDWSGTRVLRKELDLSDMSSPVIGYALQLPKTGLTSRDGSNVIFHNVDIVYDPVRDKFFVSRPRHPFDSETPDFVSSELQIACIDGSAIQSGSGTWDVLGHINSSQSGKPRNHNSGIMRSPYGYLPDFSSIRVIFAAGETGGNWLWSYRLHSINGELIALDSTGDGVVNLADFSAFAAYWMQTNCEPANCGYYADFYFDGTVDIDDLKLLTDNWLSDGEVD